MSSLISSQKRGGTERSRSSDNLKSFFRLVRRSVTIFLLPVLLWLLALFAVWNSAASPAQPRARLSPASKAAAERCRLKMKGVEDFDALQNPERGQTTKFSEEEVNAYLAEDLNFETNPSLKELRITLENQRLRAEAMIDFDRLGMTSTKLFAKIITMLFSGTHTLTAQGRLVSAEGEAHFELQQALFDDTTIPKSLVEEIITAVGQKQNPPFDPLKPSKLLYKIDKIETHRGYIIVYQRPEAGRASP
jgi:hypothetical protein